MTKSITAAAVETLFVNHVKKYVKNVKEIFAILVFLNILVKF